MYMLGLSTVLYAFPTSNLQFLHNQLCRLVIKDCQCSMTEAADTSTVYCITNELHLPIQVPENYVSHLTPMLPECMSSQQPGPDSIYPSLTSSILLQLDDGSTIICNLLLQLWANYIIGGRIIIRIVNVGS